jgi:hypothetical protein
MYVYFSKLDNMLFAPTSALSHDYLAQAADLTDLERRERALDDARRRNLQPESSH